MADLNDLISQASSNQSGTQGKASLLDYADKPQEVEAGQEEVGQDPMLSQQDVQDMSRQGAVSAVEQQIDPGVAGLSQRDQQAITDTGVDPELIFEGNAEKFGKSLVAGTGIVVNDIGNMIDYAAMTILPDEVTKSDTFLKVTERLPSFHKWGDALQKWGEVHQSPGLDEFTLDDMFKIEFWATDVAKTLPYMAAMVIPGAQGAGVARGLMTAGAKAAAKRGMFGSAKRLMKTRAAQKTAEAAAKGASKAVEGAKAAQGGKGIMGALATSAEGEIALSAAGNNIAQFLGAGVGTTAVIGAGLAGDVYNRALDMGLTEEEASEAAHGTFVDNSKWFALNGLSWGVQFGGLSGRAFKQFNRMKGGAESAKVIQKTFGQRLRSHAVKGGLVGTAEGTEEMFQETYEEWIQQKNLAEVQGKEFVSYTDFLTSDENRKTLGVSFAAGFLMGGRGGFMDSVAENGRRITNKRVSIDDDINMYENMSDAQKKVRTNEIIEAAVREDQIDGLNGFLDKLQKGNKISAEDRAEYDATIEAYAEVAATLPFQDKLTEVGQQALFNIKIKELQNKKALENLDVLKAKSIQEANENLEGEALTNELAKIEDDHSRNTESLNKAIQEGKTATAKLLAGKKQAGTAKKADGKRLSAIESFKETEEYTQLNDAQKAELEIETKALQTRLKENSYAIEMTNEIAEGLTQEEYEQFTKQGSVEKAERQKQEAEDKVQKVADTVSEGVEAVKEKVKSAMTKENIQKVKDKVKGAKDKVSEFFKSKEEFDKAGVSRQEIGAPKADSSKKSPFSRAMDAVKGFYANNKKQRDFKKAVRPFNDTIKQMSKEGKSPKEIVDKIYNKLTPEQQQEFASDYDGLQNILDYVIIASGGEVKSESKSVADEEAQIIEDEDTTTEDTAAEETVKSEEQTTEEKTQPSPKKAESKSETKIDEEAAEDLSKDGDALGKSLAKDYNAKKKKKKKGVDNQLKLEGYGFSPGEKRMKSDEGSANKATPLQYFASINPALEGAIMSAASKKFPTKQLLILREVLDSRGVPVVGMALGSAVQVTAGSDVGTTIMHEYGHVYYDMMRDNPSFQRGVSKIVKSKVFRDTKKLYSEELLYTYVDDKGKEFTLRGDQIFVSMLGAKEVFSEETQKDLEAWSEAHNKNDHETAQSLFDKILNSQVENKNLTILPDSLQENIIEESFVTSLAPQMAGNLNMFFDKGPDVVQYEGFLRKLKGRIARMITPSDAKEILKNVDNKFENMSLEEINNAIIDDIANGVNKGKFKSGKAKHLKYGVASKSVEAAAAQEVDQFIQEATEQDSSVTFDTAVDSITEAVVEQLEGQDSVEAIREIVQYKYAVKRNARNKQGLDPNGDTLPGVKSIYDEAGYNNTVNDEIDEDTYIDAEDNADTFSGDDVNVMSNDYQKQLAMDNSTSHLINAIMMIANPKGKNRQFFKGKLEAALHQLALANRNTPAKFINGLKTSSDTHIQEMMRILDEYVEPSEKMVVLSEIHNNFRNKFNENIHYVNINSNGNIVEKEAIASSESNVMANINKSANNVFFRSNKTFKFKEQLLDRIKKAKDKIDNGGSLTMGESLKIMAPVLYMSDNNQYLDMEYLSQIRVPVRGKHLGIQQLTEGWLKDKTFTTNLKQDKLSVRNDHFKNLVQNMVVAARSKNAIKTVTNVEGKATSAINMNSSMLNQMDYITKLAKTEDGRNQLIEDYPGNSFVKMVVALGQQGLENEAFKISIDGGTVSLIGNNKTVTYQNKTKEDIFFGDLENFVNARKEFDEKTDKSLTYYSQPISIFSNSKRRYSIQAPMHVTTRQKTNVINAYKAAGLDKKKYKDGTPVLDLSKKTINSQVESMMRMIEDNPSIIENNPVLKSIATAKKGKVTFTEKSKQLLSDYAFNFAINSIHAQELFVGSHEQSKSESDYIKRATGSIARHDGSMRGVSIEPILFNDIEVDGVEITDAASFILPEDLPFVQERVGARMGDLFKFVYYGADKRGERGNKNLKGQDAYLKTSTHVLTPEMIGESEVLQNIADKLRARREKNGYGESLNVAVFNSAAKKFPNADQAAIDHDADFGPDSQAQKYLNDTYMSGKKLVGLDGANMGIQLPMDNGKTKVNLATQVIGANNNNLSPAQQEKMDEIQVLEGEILDGFMNESVDALLEDAIESTPESRLKVKQLLGRAVSNNAITSTSNGVAKLLAAADDKISQNLPAMHKYYGDAIRTLIRKSAKIISNGNIAIQATSVGKDLKAYTPGVRYDSRGRKRNATLPAEAIVPASFKGKYLARVDSKDDGSNFTSAQDLKGYIDRNMVKIGSSNQAGVRIKGLDRSFSSELEAKEFLYSKMAKLEDGNYVILGEEFVGARIPAHGNQSRPTMEVIGFQTESKDSKGKHRNNSIQVPAKVNDVLGSDHDGDSIFMNFKYDNPKTNQERKVNEYIEKSIRFYENPEKLEEISASLNIDAEIEARKEAVSKRFPNQTVRSKQNTPVGAAEFFEENVTGSQMVGNVAALNNALSYLSRYNVGLGFSLSINNTSKSEFNDDYSGDFRENSPQFQSAKTLQIVLDNAKNQQATALGLNPSTIVAGTLLPRMGFSASDIDLILNSKEAKIYSKHAGRKALRNKSYSYASPAELALEELGYGEASEIVRSINQNPKPSISIDTNKIKEVNSDKETERSIIELLHRLEAVGQDVYTVNSLLGQHKTVPSNAQEAAEMVAEVEKVMSNDSAIKGETALNNLANNPVFKSFNNRLNKTLELYKKNQITGTDHALQTFDFIKSMVGGDKLFNTYNGKQSELVEDYMFNFVLSFADRVSNSVGKYATAKDGSITTTVLMEKLSREQKNIIASDQNNEFMNAIRIREHQGFQGAPSSWSISLDRDYINEHTRDFEIEAIKNDFAKLDKDVQNMLIAADFVINSGGLKNSSVSLLFDNPTLRSISASIDKKHQQVLSGIPGAISEKEIFGEQIIKNNPQVLSNVTNFVTGEFGAAQLSLLKAKTDIQKQALRANKQHYVKTINGNEYAIYKWQPAPTNKFDSKKWEQTSKKHGKYVLVSKTRKGAPKNVSNIKNAERQAQDRQAFKSALIAKSPSEKLLKRRMDSSKSSRDQGYGGEYEMFNFNEYISDKGYTVQEVNRNESLKDSLEKLYRQYQANFNLAQEFDQNIVQTGKLSSISEGRLTDYALLFQKLDPSAISGVHQAVVIELAKRAGEAQKAARNGIEWTDKGDISWLHAWFGSNNIAGNRPEIQKLVREMEKEYDNFMDENIKFQKELDRLTKNLIRDRLAEGLPMAGKVWNFTKWFAGGLNETQNSQVYGNMYDKVTTLINGKEVQELKLKSPRDFAKTNPSKAEREFYEFFKNTTAKYGKITKSALGERYKEGYIPHMKMGLLGSIKQRGMFGLYDYMLQGTGDIDGVRVKGVNPITGKSEVLPFHEWKYLYYTKKGVKTQSKSNQFKAVASLDIIRKRAEKLAKSGKHEDGKPISRTEQEIHGMMGTNLMSRFTRSRGVSSAMFGSQDLGRALSQYVNTTLFTYGNENFKGFKSMTPLLDGVIAYNKTKGNKNAVTYLENVWKRGFYTFQDSQTGLGRLADNAIHKLVKLTRIRYLSLGFSGGVGNLMVGKYNEFRSKGGKKFITGESRYWGQRKKAWALIKKQMDPEKFAYDLIQGNDSSGFDSIMMSPYIGSEHYIQGAGFVGQFTDAEWNRISEEGEIPADMKDKVDLYLDNVTRQQGYGYSKADQIGIATYSWGKAIMQFKKWVPTAVTERFQKETVDRFGQMRAGSNATAFAFGADFARGIISGEEKMSDFRKKFKKLPEHKQEAVRTFFRGMQVVSALTAISMLFGDSDDEDLRGLAMFADDTVDDIMFLTDPRRLKYMAEPASWSLVESGATMAVGIATMDKSKFKGGLTGISWTAAQVLDTSESAIEN